MNSQAIETFLLSRDRFDRDQVRDLLTLELEGIYTNSLIRTFTCGKCGEVVREWMPELNIKAATKRSTCKACQGSRVANIHRKLSIERMREVYEMYLDNIYTGKEIAKMYKISPGRVSQIVKEFKNG